MRFLVWMLLWLGLLVSAWADNVPEVIYWNSDDGMQIRKRMPADADFWQLSPVFVAQETQSFCAVASAVTVLNALPIEKPVEPVYAPYAFFTQHNFFSQKVAQFISPQTVLQQGMTREEMAHALTLHGVETVSLAGDAMDGAALRERLRNMLGDDGQFVLANYFRGTFGQVGGGHWSVLAAYDADSDRVLILDVAKYKYPPAWVRVADLQRSLATIDSTSGKARGLVLVRMPR